MYFKCLGLVKKIGPEDDGRRSKHVAPVIITKPTNALIVCNLFLNHFFKTFNTKMFIF